MAGKVADWRKVHSTPTSRLHYFLRQGLHTDVTFSLISTTANNCSRKLIPAHKLLLIAASPVFEAMLNGPLKEGDVILVEDISAETWVVMLEFIYTSTLSPDTTIHDAVELLYAARKYDLPDLAEKCTELLKSDLNERNAVSVYQAGKLLEDKELEMKAEGWIMGNLYQLMAFEDSTPTDFVNMTIEDLQYFLSKDELDISELDLFLGVLKWASVHQQPNKDDTGASDDAECSMDVVPSTANNMSKSDISSIVPLIRFPLMTAEDFALTVVPSGLLSLEDSVCILQHLSCTKDKRSTLPLLKFSDKQRSTNNSYTAHFAVRLTDMVYPYVSNILYFDSFEVDAPIILTHLGFPAPDQDDACYDVAIQIQVQSTNSLIYQTNQSITCKRRSVMKVSCESSVVRLEPSVLYKVIYKLKGPDTYYADQRIERFPVRSKSSSKPKIVNFRYIAYSCRLIEIGFGF